MILYEDELGDNGVSLLTVKVVFFFYNFEYKKHNSLYKYEIELNIYSTIAESYAEMLVSSSSLLGKLII